MSDHVNLVLFLTYHFLEALQSGATDVIQHWSTGTLKDVLSFGANYQKAISKLDTSEIACLREHISAILPCFQQFSLDLLSSDPLINGLSCLLEVLVANPYLSNGHRDVIFEFCLDSGVELPKFPPLADRTTYVSVEVSSAIHCRCFIAHIRVIASHSANVYLFLDSCFAISPDSFTSLLIGALEQLVDPIGDTEHLEKHIIDWLIAAIDRDHTLRIRIVHQNPQRLRDLILASPTFEECIVRLFDERYLLTVDDPAPFVHLLRCLANSIPRWPELCRRVRHLSHSDSQHAPLWKELFAHTTTHCA